MILTIPQTALYDIEQELNFSENNICTLIGRNGSGKSSILEAIFEKYSLSDEFRVISFSSGQNERFSKIYNNHKSNKFKKITQVDNDTLEYINIYHFDKTWVKILVFLATSLFNKKTRNFLKEKYINSDDIDDLSSRLQINLHIPKFYINQIQEAYKKEKTDPMHKSVRRTYLHAILTKIIEKGGYEDYDFEEELKISLSINAKETYDFFESDIDKIFTFLSLTNYGTTSMFDIKNASLFFKNDIEFDGLSDGEYQLLTIYALVDLFYTDNTLFLFDEIDSHLHYSNIKKLWDSLKQISGKAVTTTHISESILNNHFENLFYIEDGIIKKDLTAEAVTKKLENIIGEKTYSLKVASRIQNLALLDDLDDWTIFKKLARKKIGVEVNTIFDKVVAFKRESSFNTTSETFGKSKMIYVNQFKTKNESNHINTKNFFLICDRDKLPLTEIRENLEVQIPHDFSSIKSFNSNNTKTYLLSWKRLEIENYLLSKTMLDYNQKLECLKGALPMSNIDNMINFDGCENIANYDAKIIVHPLYKQNGFNEVELDGIIDKIPSEEISEDIVKMYNFIKEKVEG